MVDYRLGSSEQSVFAERIEKAVAEEMNQEVSVRVGMDGTVNFSEPGPDRDDVGIYEESREKLFEVLQEIDYGVHWSSIKYEVVPAEKMKNRARYGHRNEFVIVPVSSWTKDRK